MSRTVRVSRFAGVLLALSSCCGLSPTLAWAQQPGVASLKGQATPQAAAPTGPVVDRTDYVLGPGDQIQVFVWRNPDLSATVPIRPDGRISTPLVEDMVAVGKTPSQLARDVEKVLAEYVRTPQVNVSVTQPASTFRLTVLDAILASGGLGQFAAGNRAKLVRTVDGKQTEIKLKISNLLNDGDMKQNVPLQPGDVLIIPESRF
jgi:polysaccharide export outer membrane protein